jgi:putative DNA primase/helicase
VTLEILAKIRQVKLAKYRRYFDVEGRLVFRIWELWLHRKPQPTRGARAFTPMSPQNLPIKTIRFAVNTSGKDKDFNYEVLARDFKDTTGTIQDVADHVKAGHAICAGLLGNRRRCKANVIGSNWIPVDIDNSDVERDAEGKPIKDSEGKTKKIYKHQLTIAEALENDFVKKYCALIYTTASHTPEWEKFRLIFVLSEYVEGADIVEAAINFLLDQFPHDPACKDASRVFYGSTKAEFPLINPEATLPEDWTARAVQAAETKRQETEQRLKEWEENKERYREYSAEQGWDTDKLIEEALTFIPPRCPGSGNYKECTDVLMALTSHYGAVEAEAIAEKWSPTIRGKWEVGKKIRSYQSNGIGIGTLFHIAKQYGFRFPARTVTVVSKPRPSVVKIEPATDIPAPKPLTSKPPKGIPGDAAEIVYTYSDNQWVVGYQYQYGEEGEEGGLEEIEFRQYNRLPDKSIEMRKGVKPWPAYKFNEAIALAAATKQEKILPILVLAQNEKQVEVARERGLSAFTFAGRVWSREEVRAEFLKAKKQLGEFVISWISSTEEDRIQEAKKQVLAANICRELGIKFVMLEADADFELTGVEEVLEITSLSELEEKIIGVLDKPKNKNTPLEENNRKFLDHKNPDSNLISIIDAFNLDPQNCATYITFESWVYNQKFTSGKDWFTLDSAYYEWSEGEHVWEHQPDNVVLKLIASSGAEAYKMVNTKDFSWVATKPYESNNHKESAFKYNRNRLEIPQEYLSRSSHLIAFNNCVVDARTGEKLPHDKEYYLTNKIPYDYEPNKPCPKLFHDFIVDSLGEEYIEIVRAFTRMFLDPTAPYGRFPYLVGQSGGGKGTLLRLWGSLFGEGGSGSSSSFADISTPEGRHQYLTGKKIFIFPDMGGFVQGLRAFYELVDNGELTGRALYNSATYSKKWNVKFAMASVDYIQIENAGDGFGRRALIMLFKNRIVIPDPGLGKKLEAIKADIISWALAMSKEECDRILLSPPEPESAKIASLNAALYADSTRSFVDLCLRPTSEPSIVSNALLHELYRAYCKVHGYSPLGMSKFISHLKTILPYNFNERSWNPMVDGVRERTQAHWEYIHIPPEIFRKIGLNTNIDCEQQHNPEWICVKAQCQDGGLTEFEDFWNKPRVEPNLNPQQTPEHTNSKDVLDVQGSNIGSGDSAGHSDSALRDKESVRRTDETPPAAPTLDSCGQPSHQDPRQKRKIPPPDCPQESTGTPPLFDYSIQGGNLGSEAEPCNPQAPPGESQAETEIEPSAEDVAYNLDSFQHAIQAMSWEMISELTAHWTFAMKRAIWRSLTSEERKTVRILDPNSNYTGGSSVKPAAPPTAPIDETIRLQSEVEVVAYGKHKGKKGSVVEVPDSTRAEHSNQYRVSFFDGTERHSTWFYEWELRCSRL